VTRPLVIADVAASEGKYFPIFLEVEESLKVICKMYRLNPLNIIKHHKGWAFRLHGDYESESAAKAWADVPSVVGLGAALREMLEKQAKLNCLNS
jgi:hypothetical protein